MSSNVDNRIVNMQFNNQQFESNAQDSIKTLDKLKNSLNLEGSAKSLSNLEKVGRSFTLAGIADGVESLQKRFSTLGIIGITALQNITNSAINMGKRFVSSLTIDPIKTGLDEYETKINAIQTILTNTESKGTTLDDVNKALGELNEYADKTIYNFAEMTRNIGTFTAAGIDLNTSVKAIKGIANLAAGSGSSAMQASTAMYQLSQALAAGSVKLQDWNSVVNAGMGGELFQKALKDTAKQMGIFVDESVPFRESLKDGWITSEVLTKTLEGFAENESLVKAATQVKTFTQLIDTMKESVQSGWAVSWEHILGDKDEATSLFTAISDGFNEMSGASADARNSMLLFWKDNGGRTAILQGISNALLGLASVMEPIEQAFRDIFPAMTGERLVQISESIKEVTSRFKIGEDTADKLRRTFAGLFAVLDIGKQALSAVVKGIGRLISSFAPAGSGILSITANIGDFLVALNESIKSSDIFNVAIDKIGTAISTVSNLVKTSVKKIVDSFKSFVGIDTSGIDAFTDRLNVRFKPLTAIGSTMKSAMDAVVSVMKKISPVLTKISEVLGKVFGGIGSAITDALVDADFNALFDILNSGIFAAILLAIRKFISSLSDITGEAKGFLGGITNVLDGVKGSLEAYQSSLKAGTLLKIASAIGILAVALIALSMIDSAKLTVALSAMTVMFVELFTSMGIFQKVMSTESFRGMTKMTTSMIALSLAVLILSTAMVKLASLDWDGISKGIVAVTALSSILVASAKLLSQSSGAMIKGSVGFIAFSAAILILTSAVSKLGAIDAVSLAKGLTAVGVLAAELALFMKMTDLGKMGISSGIGMIGLATAILILSSAVDKFGSLDAATLTKGLVSIAGALGVIVLALNLMPQGIVSRATALVVIAGALVILSKAITSMGGMSWSEVAVGLTTLAGSLLIIATAMAFMTSALPGAAAMLVLSSALAIFTPMLLLLGNTPLSEIGVGLLALAGVFTIVGVAGLVLAPLTPVILALSGAIALLGVGCLAVGAGLLAFATGITALAVAGTAGATSVSLFITTVVKLIPTILTALAKGIIEFVKVLGEGAVTIATTFKKLLLGLIDVIVDVIPAIVNAIYKLLLAILTTLKDYIPKIVEVGMELILGFLKGISKNIKQVVSTAIEVVLNFIKGISDMIPDIIQAGYDLMLSFINGLADSIRNNAGKMTDAVFNVISAIVEAAIDVLMGSIKGFIKIGGNIVEGLIEGVTGMIGAAVDSVKNLGKSILNGAKKVLGIHSPSTMFKEIGKNIGEGLTNGINGGSKDAVKASENMSNEVTKASSKTVQKSNEASKKAFDKSVAWIDERKYYNKLSLDEELKAWEDIQKQYAKGSDERTKADKEVYRVKKEIRKADYDDAVKNINDLKYYNKLSLADELEAWKEIQKQYKKGSDERVQADKEVYRLKNEIRKAEYDAEVKNISDLKYYNQLSTYEEFLAWQAIQQKYAEGSEERIQADKEVYRVRNELLEKQKTIDEDYYNKSKEINDKAIADIQSLNDEYERSIESRTQALYSAYSLFDKVDPFESVSGYDLMYNLETQIDAFEYWSKNISELASKGINDGLLEELRNMGPSSVAQIEALNALSAIELQKYSDLWQEKHNLARTQAIQELEGLRIDTDVKIEEINTTTKVSLDELEQTWKVSLAEITGGTKVKLEELTTVFDTKTKTLVKETKSKFTDMASTIKNMDWEGVGVSIVNGMRSGIMSRANALATAAASVALQALQAAKSALGIHSPSREFAKLGMYADEGFAIGLDKYSNVVDSSATDIGKTAIQSMKDAISSIADVISGDLDMTPTIRPVIDLSDVKAGSKTIGGLLGGTSINVSGSVKRAGSIANGLSRTNSESTPSTQPTADVTYQFTQNNYSPKALSRLDIYRQTKNQFSAMKGLVTSP